MSENGKTFSLTLFVIVFGILMFSGIANAKTYTFTETEVLNLQHEMVNRDKKIETLQMENSYIQDMMKIQKKHYEDLIALKDEELKEKLRIKDSFRENLIMQYEALNAIQESRIADLKSMNDIQLQNVSLYMELLDKKDKTIRDLQKSNAVSDFFKFALGGIAGAYYQKARD